MIALPAVAAVIAALCAAFVGWDALRRPSPERVIWAGASSSLRLPPRARSSAPRLGWSPTLARVYYLTGAVLVVGVLALGELYLLLPGRMPAITPGIALLIVAVAATAVWSAPIDCARLPTEGWQALERGPFLVRACRDDQCRGHDGACRRRPLLGVEAEGGWRFGPASGRMRADRRWGRSSSLSAGH